MKEKMPNLFKQVAKVKHQLIASKLLKFLLSFGVWVITTASQNGGKIPMSSLFELARTLTEDVLSDLVK